MEILEIKELKQHLETHIWKILDAQDEHSSPCYVGTLDSFTIAGMIADYAARLVSEHRKNCAG